jgi:hypothetical protein
MLLAGMTMMRRKSEKDALTQMLPTMIATESVQPVAAILAANSIASREQRIAKEVTGVLTQVGQVGPINQAVLEQFPLVNAMIEPAARDLITGVHLQGQAGAALTGVPAAATPAAATARKSSARKSARRKSTARKSARKSTARKRAGGP